MKLSLKALKVTKIRWRKLWIGTATNLIVRVDHNMSLGLLQCMIKHLKEIIHASAILVHFRIHLLSWPKN